MHDHPDTGLADRDLPAPPRPPMTRAERGRRLHTGSAAVTLALQIHGQLDVLSTVMRTMGVHEAVGSADTPKTSLREAVEQSIAGLLLTFADCDHLLYADVIVQDHVEAWENDGMGTSVDDLAGLLDELGEQKPWRHLLVQVSRATGDGPGVYRFPVTDPGQYDTVGTLSHLVAGVVGGSVNQFTVSIAAGAADRH